MLKSNGSDTAYVALSRFTCGGSGGSVAGSARPAIDRASASTRTRRETCATNRRELHYANGMARKIDHTFLFIIKII